MSQSTCDTATLADLLRHAAHPEADIVWGVRSRRCARTHDTTVFLHSRQHVGKPRRPLPRVNWKTAPARSFRLRQPLAAHEAQGHARQAHHPSTSHKLPGCRRRITDPASSAASTASPRAHRQLRLVSSTACTVLMHLNSSVMKRHGEVIDKFELFMRQSPNPLHRRKPSVHLCPQQRDCCALGYRPLTGLNESSARPPARSSPSRGPHPASPSVKRASLRQALYCSRCLPPKEGRRPEQHYGLHDCRREDGSPPPPDMRVRVYNSETALTFSDVDRVWSGFDCVVYSPTSSPPACPARSTTLTASWPTSSTPPTRAALSRSVAQDVWRAQPR
jgi:hypothetical protein